MKKPTDESGGDGSISVWGKITSIIKLISNVSSTMKFADRNSDLSRFTEVPELLEAMLNNQRIMREGQEDPPQVTDAIKYTNRPKKRRKPDSYNGNETIINRNLDLFGFDEGPMPFQAESWRTILELDEAREETGNSQAALVTAPTGIGKTECFLGPVFDRIIEGRGENTIIVYPRRSLLQDQLGRILKHVHDIKTDERYDADPSIGLRFGSIPLRKSEVHNESGLVNQYNDIFKLAKCWVENENGEKKPFFLNSGDGWYQINCSDGPTFGHEELVLHRNGLKNNTPDIILTTLESLELFALKPNNPIIDSVDTIVLDEVHLFNGTYGAHAAHILQNIQKAAVSDHPFLFIGASATLDGPNRFARKLFDLPKEAIEVIEPKEGIDYELGDDLEHYYFHLSGEDVGVSSTYLQQLMLFGHSMLDPKDSTKSRRKILSFIDSVSQVNQRHAQFGDADDNKALWKYHAQNYTDRSVEYDWESVAENNNNKFTNEPLRAVKGHAGDPLQANEIKIGDLLTSTSYMEVGIDVPDIKVITQYRTPFNLSSFVQRSGRAARKSDMDAHIATFLSQNETTDANLFHRASRFLNSEITTPLNTENDIIQWIHNCYLDFYRIADDVRSSNRDNERVHDEFLSQYLGSELNFQEFYTFLDTPISTFETVLGQDSVDDILNENNPLPILDQDTITRIDSRLSDEVTNLNNEIQPLLQFINIAGDKILHQDNAVNRFFEEIQNHALQAIKEFKSRIKDKLFLTEHEELEDATRKLEELEHKVQKPLEEDTDANKQRFKEVVGELLILNGTFTGISARENVDLDELQPRGLQEFIDAVDNLSTLLDEEQFREKQRKRKQIYYLRNALDELQNYLGPTKPYLSLYSMKALLRTAYYFNQYIDVTGENDVTIHYVPENYFSDSGLSFTLRTPDGGNEEPVSKLMTQLVPFKPQYDDDGRNMMIIQPKVERNKEGDLVFDYTSRISGDIRDNILIPDSVESKFVYDRSGDESRQIIGYCSDCYNIPSGRNGSCPHHGNIDYGSIYAEPIVDSRVEGTPAGETLGKLTFGQLTGQVRLSGVRLEVTPAYPMRDSWNLKYDNSKTEVIKSPETPIGFALDTRGVVWNIGDLFDRVDIELIQEAEKYKDFEDGGEFNGRDCLRRSAAHYLLLIISDVSGAAPSELLYGIDEDSEQVFVYEQTLGGQGVTDLLYETITDGNVDKVLNAMGRVGYNEQIENQRLWASDQFVAELKDREALDFEDYTRDIEKNEIQSLLNELRPSIHFESVVDSLAEEVILTLDRIAGIADDQSLGAESAYQVKQTVATAQLGGESEVIQNVRQELDSEITNYDQISNLLVSPDVDGCVENLHVPNCTSVKDQEDILSYRALEEIREELIQEVDDSEGLYRTSIGETSLELVF